MRSDLAAPRVAVVGATGAVGRVTLDLLRERAYTDVAAFASARSAGSTIDGLLVEEATPDRLAEGDFDVCLFSVGTDASRELVPPTAAAGALCVDKSAAFRLEDERAARRPRGERRPSARAPRSRGQPQLLLDPPGADARAATRCSRPSPGARLDLPVGFRRGLAGTRASSTRVARGARPAHGLVVRRGGVRRGGEDPGRDAQDP